MAQGPTLKHVSLRPERVLGLVSAGATYNIQDIAGAANPGSPDQKARDWYQYYFHIDRGRKGLEQKRSEIARLLWQTWSPSWHFDADAFEQSAASFDNPDFVDVVIHSYRHRYGVVPGDPAYAPLESLLAKQPPISVPTIVLLGAGDGVDQDEEA